MARANFEVIPKVVGEFESKYNLGMFTVVRIDNILKACHNSSINGQLSVWLAQLYCLHKEMCAQLKQQEDTKIESLLQEATNKVFVHQQVKHNTSYFQAYHKLRIAEKELRILLQKKGMLVPAANDANVAVGNTGI